MLHLKPKILRRSMLRFSVMLLGGLLLNACQQQGSSTALAAEDTAAATVLQVLKDPSCGCCEGWVQHVNEQGFLAQISHPQDLNGEKLKLGIAPQFQSCHTAVSPEGYVFEGHIPANIVERYLAEKPENAIGLAVPGMPMGSPGMEIGDQFHPYDVLLLKNDGSAQIYAHIATKSEQY
jgi:hypothetical protein